MGDFELDAILYFMIERGGRVRNHELVTHFKNFLNHPNNKVENREKFKNYVNELATIKIDAGEKVLVLKKKYRPNTDSFDSSAASGASWSASASVPYTSQSKSNKAPPKTNVSEPNLAGDQANVPVSSTSNRESVENDSPRARSEPPAVASGGKGKETDVDSPDGGMVSKVRSDENMEVKMRRTDRVSTPKTENSSSMNSGSSSKDSLASTGSQKSAGSSTSGVASMEDDANASVISVKDKIKKLNKIHSESDITQSKHGSGGGNKKSYKYGADDDDSHSSGSSYVTLDAEQKDWMVVCSTTEYHDMNRLLSKNPNLASLKDFTNYTALHWAAKAGKAEVIKLIANKPGVNIDQRSGYTALHLAAIHGHEHIIELLVQTFKADANLRDYSGKKAKQYLKNSASSKAQQLLVSRRLGSDSGHMKSSDDSFSRSASMRMSNRAKAMSSLMQAKSAIARQPMLRSSWGGSAEDVYSDKSLRTPPGSANSSPGSTKKGDMDLMPPPPNAMMSKRMRHDRSKSSSRENSQSPTLSRKNDANQNMMRSGSDSAILEKKTTIV